MRPLAQLEQVMAAMKAKGTRASRRQQRVHEGDEGDVQLGVPRLLEASPCGLDGSNCRPTRTRTRSGGRMRASRAEVVATLTDQGIPIDRRVLRDVSCRLPVRREPRLRATPAGFEPAFMP